jgi:ATP-dependent protease ClpP protease subunit
MTDKPSPLGVQMRAEADRATLTLMGAVGWEITPDAVARALKDAAGKPITISLHSGGGDALAGIAIHNMIARHKGAKTVVVEGFAASAASLIAMAGDRIVMPSNAFLMIHEAWGGAMGDAEQMRGTAALLDSISAAYRSTYAKRSGLEEDEVAELMRAETWFTAAEAVAKGLATEEAEPAEIVASVNADALKAFRNVPAALATLAIASTPPAPPAPPEEVRMSEPVPQAGGQPPAAPPVAAPAVPPKATLAEIKALATRGGLDSDWVIAQFEAGATVQAATDAALDAVAGRADRPMQPGVVAVTGDEKPKILAAMEGAVVATLTGKVPEGQAREYMSGGLHGMMRDLLVRSGHRNVHRLGAHEMWDIFASQHTTSDFARVLANSTNKSLREMYMGFPNTWSSWCAEVDVADYKTITAASIGQFPEIRPVSEGGAYDWGTIAEEGETYSVSERGRLLGLSKQAIINDDLRAFQGVINAAALSGYTALRRVVFGILTANGNLSDAVALFAAGRGNIGSAGNMSATTIAELIQLLMQQNSPARVGELAAPLPPPTSLALLVSPAELRTAYELVGNMIVPTTTGNALPTEYRSMISVVPEPLLNTGSQPYYMARTEPGMRAVEIAYIRGQRMPVVNSAEEIGNSGVTFRVVFDFGAAAVQARTIAANLG